MYYIIKGTATIRAPTIKIKEYVKPNLILTQEDKLNIGTKIVLGQYTNYSNKNLGSFIGLKKVDLKTITTGVQGYEYCDFELDVELYFYKVTPKEIIDFTVVKIWPQYIQGLVNSYSVEIPMDHLANITPVYNAALNCFQLGDKKIKEQDLIRARVTSIYNPLNMKGEMFKIKGTCRSAGSGKINLKTQ